MDSEQAIRIALTVITPILTAGVGIVALVVGDWRERRTQDGRRKLSFEDASRQVKFAEDWFEASRKVAPQNEGSAAARARIWLDEAAQRVSDSTPPPRPATRAVTVRRLLLAYPMNRRSARVLRALYYVTLGSAVLQLSGALGAAFGRTDTLGIPDYFSGGFIYADLLGIVIWTVAAMGFHFWSRRAEESQPEVASRRLSVRDALLLTRLTGPRANIARVLYWLWLAITAAIVVASAVTIVTDPRSLPSNLTALVAWAGWAIGLRHWALSCSRRASTAPQGAAARAVTPCGTPPPGPPAPDRTPDPTG